MKSHLMRDNPRSPGSAGKVMAALLAALLAFGPLAVADSSAAEADDDALVASVDLGRITETIETLEGFGSREFHLESSRQAAEFLHGAFEEIGVPVEYQYFTVGDTTVSNVVATLEGSDPGAGMYLFGAHYDSENREVHNLSTAENLTAPGADDDASGVAAVLEMARILSGSDFPGTVKFVMFGAEEMGYDDSGGVKGSEHFATTEAALGREYAGTAALDMIGYRAGPENKAVIIVNDDDNALASSTAKATGEFGIDLDLDILVMPTLTFSDHASFWRAGIPSMLVIEEIDLEIYYPLNTYYHTSFDTIDTLSLDQVVAVTGALLGGLLIAEGGGDGTLLVFGIALMVAAIVSVAAFIYIRRRQGRLGNDT